MATAQKSYTQMSAKEKMAAFQKYEARKEEKRILSMAKRRTIRYFKDQLGDKWTNYVKMQENLIKVSLKSGTTVEELEALESGEEKDEDPESGN